MKNVRIKGIEVYYPDEIKNTDEIIKKYKQTDKEIELAVKEFFGKQNLRMSDDKKENTLTMSIKAAEKVLESTSLEGKDIDMIVLSSLLPEYLSPPTSTLIHKAISGKDTAICYDLNINCIGMTTSLDQISSQMKSDRTLNRVLLVGCDIMAPHIENKNIMLKSVLGCAACAIILEKTDEDCGVIETRHYINTKGCFPSIAFPICGASNIYQVPEEERKMKFGNPEASMPVAAHYIRDTLNNNGIGVNDISMFCFSQFALYYIEYLREVLSIPEEKSLHVGADIGYTGTTSPFLVLNSAIKEGKVKRGDYVFFWTAGMGMQHIFLLLKY